MARKQNQKYCDWCMKKIKRDEIVCESCKPAWQERVNLMTPIRAKTASAKVLIDATKEARKDLCDAVKAAQTVLIYFQNQQIDQDAVVSAELALALGIEEVGLGSWYCEHSPTGKCFYDSAKDYCNDSCLMCGKPDERK